MSFLDQYKTKGGSAAEPGGPVTQVDESLATADIQLDMDIGAPYPSAPAGAPAQDRGVNSTLVLPPGSVTRGPADEPFAATATQFPRPGVRPGADAAASAPLIAESRPSELTDDFLDSRQVEPAPAAAPAARGLPLIGGWAVARQQRVLGALVMLGLLALLAGIVLAFGTANRGADQVRAVGDAVTQAQRLPAAALRAVTGQAAAFAELGESTDGLSQDVRGLADGRLGLPALLRDDAAALVPTLERSEQAARAVLAQRDALVPAGQALRRAARQSGALADAAEALVAAKLQNGATPAEIIAAAQLATIAQRLGRNAGEFVGLEGPGPDAAAQLAKDVPALRELAAALLDGNAERGLPGTRDLATRERLSTLVANYEPVRAALEPLLPKLPAIAAAREAQKALATDAEALRQGLDALQSRVGGTAGLVGFALPLMIGGVLLAALGGAGFLRLFVGEQAQRARLAQTQREAAERQEQQAKRVNDANQAAILRLMNELQAVAEGDLTQQATVTEDITGAIADSVNYTVEELRNLVAQVQSAVGRVAETTQQVDDTSTELLAASTEQLREIHETGESVLQMAGRINEVSAQAQQTAAVAQQSLVAAESGRAAVQDTIGGMNAMRDQIQETSKRIKRLGESSQEIGEITELISDITEQTNVLALNAAIQAASAGEAGRGFSVVAEEVQRLAERSADATRQIAALVKAIQTDTQDAVAAMERSTQGVVESTRLSDAAGSALADIERVTRELSELIARISSQALGEAQLANVVAANIQHIFAVTEQTGDGTRSTAQMVRELSRTAEELSRSVDRFKIS